jgi:hypothetical protein
LQKENQMYAAHLLKWNRKLTIATN